MPRLPLALLLAALGAAPVAVQAQAMGGGPAGQHHDLTTLDPYPADRGWQGLANLLEAMRPGTDTRLDPAPSQVTDRIELLLAQGDNAGALALVEKRQAERDRQGVRGTDVQLMFQHARALAALGRTQESIAVYTDMTTRFPELPEPWNNLAALYAARGELDRAQDALNMALRANPDYADARANMGDLQLLMALRTYRQAGGQGAAGAHDKAQEIENLLKEKRQQ
ncbi:tetratricopeptide repeat protein [Bordetella genomosp. 13]|uniref:tetratricopeptide repeat protein n=1 Tax=Bordetella genomosp. 13 TaxID=463040 RepID=UPI0021B5562C|nr:tetratricopeptide repeat protein [Bordetella genomosp. 13]